jgi:hypothetical protein
MTIADSTRKQICLSFAVIVCALVGGCATMSDVTRTNPEPLFEPPADDFKFAEDDKNKPGPSGASCYHDWLKKASPSIPSDVRRFTGAMSCALNEDPAALSHFARVGKSLASRYCDIFLDGLEDKRVHTVYNQSNMNSLFAAAAAILTRGANHTQSVFNLATGAAAANALIDNYRANYVMTHSIYQLREKLLQMRTELDRVIEQNISTSNYHQFDEVKDDLLEYADVCSHKTLVFIVNASLSATRITAGPAESPLAKRNLKALLDGAKKIDTAITSTELSQRQFALLFALISRENLAADIEALDKVDSQTKKNIWSSVLKDEDLGRIVKALALGKPAGSVSVSLILDIAAAQNFKFGAGYSEQVELAKALKVPAGAEEAPTSQPTPRVVPRVSVRETRSALRFEAAPR